MFMLLIFHLVSALSSLSFATYSVFRPSRRGLGINYALAGMTIISGSYLAFSTNSHLLSACATGLFYTSIVTFELIAANRRLVSQVK
jgi:hypothetical protein